MASSARCIFNKIIIKETGSDLNTTLLSRALNLVVIFAEWIAGALPSADWIYMLLTKMNSYMSMENSCDPFCVVELSFSFR